MFVFISGAVNNDNLAYVSLGNYFNLARPCERITSATLHHTHFTSSSVSSFALAALTKQSALGSFGLAGLTSIAISLQHPRPSNLQLQSLTSLFIVHSPFFLIVHFFLVVYPQ